jgi:ABC transporter, ATP-binding protein
MIFEAKNGSFAYKKSKTILENINFSIQSNEVLAILGPNGVGKTTLLKCITGLHPWTGGFSSIDGRDISTMSPKEFFSKASYVPQAKAPAFAFKARELVILGRSVHIGNFSKPGKKDYEMVDKVMDELSISHLSDKYCHQISGGELQMLLIARALVQEPSILILDEPESNLDFRNQLIILKTIRKLADKGLICIFNTHYPSHSFSIADKCILLGKDKTSIFGNIKDVLNQKNIEKTFKVHVDIVNNTTPIADYTTVTALELSD